MKIFKIVWGYGKEQYVVGRTFRDACKNEGINVYSIGSLDHYEEVKEIPDNFKRFEIVSDSGIEKIHNPHFIKGLKNSVFKEGVEVKIDYISREFKFKYLGKTTTAFQYSRL